MRGLYLLLKEIPAVAGATVKETALRSFRDTIGENMLTMNFFNLLFACVIACGVVYNIARISLSERSHELATLRVIGFTRYEISAILLGELAVITLLAIPFGLALGYFFSWLVSLAYDTELYRVPFVVERATYGRAVVVILLAATASGLIVRRKLDRLDLVSVLKSYD
jgi:putative ABC transport system permease protein